MDHDERSGRPAWGIRAKLVLLFVVIKVMPLLALAWLAWAAAEQLGVTVSSRAESMANSMLATVRSVGDEVTSDAIDALDDRSREALERLTTDTARAVATFLYDRDADVRQAALVEPTQAAYQEFLRFRTRPVFAHGPWRLRADEGGWVAESYEGWEETLAAQADAALPDNANSFSARPPEYLGRREERPLFVEMSFIGLDGQERLKIVTGDLTAPGLRDVSDVRQTFVHAEDYWPELKKLKAGEIYVSDVIGEYVGSHVIGPYTPAAAEKAGIAFEPEKSAYAGTENPVGRRFRGIVRWATPVTRGNSVIGYVTLALDHDHLRQFTDRISPTEGRYTPISDAIAGNYAFMWDHNSRAISHPRDYFIPGYDGKTGAPVMPWLDQDFYDEWQASGKSASEFLAGVVPFDDQSLKKKPAKAMVKLGQLGLDCRYLNFSPQCAGWKQLTEKGGSGSFKIFFSGLWKLTTAAAIPYYTGQYGATPQGFGFVTIGANVDEFHRAATESAARIGGVLDRKREEFAAERAGMLASIAQNLKHTALQLSVSTLLMVVVVIGVALWMAAFITRQITRLSAGIGRFRAGELGHRIEVRSNDELGQLAGSFNRMADAVEESFQRVEEGRARAEEANRMKSTFLANISHELRTPLNGILGFAELLQLESSEPNCREYAETIKSSGDHLLHVVNDLLDLAKIEAGKMEIRIGEIDTADFARSVCAVHERQARSKGLQFECEVPGDTVESFQSDAVRVQQILNNLLNNAVKFTERGKIRLSVSNDGDGVRFAVQDTGCGIAAEEREHIFEPFRQVDAFLTRGHDGTGLGLTLVRQLAYLLGAEIAFESEVGSGSTFCVRFPLRTPAAQRS
jgi:signal transduction histidine kinase